MGHSRVQGLFGLRNDKEHETRGLQWTSELGEIFPFGGSEGVFEMATHCVLFLRKEDTSAWGGR